MYINFTYIAEMGCLLLVLLTQMGGGSLSFEWFQNA
jgi:hypothetical protein